MKQIASRGEFADLTVVAKSKWTRVLQHNEADCLWSSMLAEACGIGVDSKGGGR
jgi:hypothetical protein